MSSWIGTSWETVGFIALSTVGIFLSALMGIRVAGRRTVSEMSAFDFIVTVAIGSIIASAALLEEPSLLDGIAALTTLLLLQMAIAAGRRRWRWFRKAVDLSPVVLVRRGRLTEEGLKTPQLTRHDVMQRLREAGVYSLEGLELVVLEGTGKLTIVRHPDDLDAEAIEAMRGQTRGGTVPRP